MASAVVATVQSLVKVTVPVRRFPLITAGFADNTSCADGNIWIISVKCIIYSDDNVADRDGVCICMGLGVLILGFSQRQPNI